MYSFVEGNPEVSGYYIISDDEMMMPNRRFLHHRVNPEKIESGIGRGDPDVGDHLATSGIEQAAIMI